MTKFFTLFFFMFYLSAPTNSAVLFDPHNLSSTKGTWHKTSGDYKGEYYHNFYLNGHEVVFRVLERYVPAAQCLISYAKTNHGRLRIADPTIIFYDSPEIIKNNMSVVDGPSCSTIIDPAVVTLSTIKPRGMFKSSKNKYYVSFCETDDDTDIEITEGVYQVLQIARQKAMLQKNFLEINMELLTNKGSTKKALVTIVPPPEDQHDGDETTCVVCLDKKRNMIIKPCNHVCLCEECSKSNIAACPMCRGQMTATEKVYF